MDSVDQNLLHLLIDYAEEVFLAEAEKDYLAFGINGGASRLIHDDRSFPKVALLMYTPNQLPVLVNHNTTLLHNIQ
jgi:hypothetical protein